MTVRSEGQFNTVVYEDADIYRGQERRDVILMNAHDTRRMRLSVDQPVTVRSESGELTGIIVRTADIPPGNAAMYYPEANVLVPRLSDSRSRTPAFKNIKISIIS
jgi:anaerobic selenocysteine-containing dehydrogenase